MFKRVTIIGLGLIGGSLGLAIKEKNIAGEIIGVSRRRSTIFRALSLGIVDRATLDIKKGVRSSDLVILSAPVLKIIDLAKSISGSLSKGAIVIDAGSTKSNIVKSIESVLPDTVSFIGSHPLAGSEKSGVIYADKDLFKASYCILTRSPRTDARSLAKIKKFWAKIGMRIEIMTPEKHDKVLSRLSHLPHASSVGLCNMSNKKDLHLAAGGFRDTTRIASGNPEVWKDIFLTNRENIARDIKALKRELSKIEKALKDKDSARLLKLFRRAKDIRDSM